MIGRDTINFFFFSHFFSSIFVKIFFLSLSHTHTEHVAKYNSVALNAVKKRFPGDAGVISNYYAPNSTESLIFCHFAQSLQDNKYDQVRSMDTVRFFCFTSLLFIA
jgi:hypothetical protein